MNPDKWQGERDWARQQLEEHAATTPAEDDVVMRMLEEWWDARLVTGVDDPWRALGVFEQLARGRALETPAEAEHRWVQARPGALVMRDRVRVRADAYPGRVGQLHNGRAGVIVGVRNGDIIVKYDNASNDVQPTHHSPHALEKRTT